MQDMAKSSHHNLPDFKIKTPHGEYILAERSTRFVAKLFDHLIPIILFLGLASLSPDTGPHGGQGSPFWLFIMSILLMFIIFQIYYLSVDGQTISKKFFKIRIVSKSEETPGGFMQNVLNRGLGNFLLSVFIPVYALVDALFIFRENRRCVHDLMAGTIVIKDVSRKFSWKTPLIISLCFIIPLTLVYIYFRIHGPI